MDSLSREPEGSSVLPDSLRHRSLLTKFLASPSYLLTMLWLVSLFRMIDMQVIAVLMEPIKSEFSFTDTQLGLLSGLSFALVYSLLGLPVAWLADRYNRVRIISAALAVWSLMTLLCGQATGFLTFFLARMGVGIGEAGGYAPSAALLADRVSGQYRSRAFAILGSAIPLGVFMSFLLGAFLLKEHGWRTVYFVIGLPGLLLAFVMSLTLADTSKPIFPDPKPAVISCREVLVSAGELLSVKAFRLLLIAASGCTLAATGSGMWMPSFFMRVHALPLAETGIWMACIYGAGGLLGTLAGGWFSDRWIKHSRSQTGAMYFCSITVLAVIPFAITVLFAEKTRIALAALAVMAVLMHMNVGPVLALVQTLASDRHRAMAQALNVLFSSMLGLGCGALIVGGISDALMPEWGTVALPTGILVVMLLGYSFAALCFLKAAVQYRLHNGASIHA
jgi:MFS family permease